MVSKDEDRNDNSSTKRSKKMKRNLLKMMRHVMETSIEKT